jgi:hypothetical protein
VLLFELGAQPGQLRAQESDVVLSLLVDLRPVKVILNLLDLLWQPQL